MALLMRFVKSSESIVFKNCPSTLRKNWNVECAFAVKKADIPAPPKRPLSAYMIFCKENRSNILKEEPSLSSPEQIKRLAVKWGELNNDMKKPYEISARQSTVVYGEAHKKFYENLTEHQKEELARLKEEKKESRRKLKLNKALQKSGIPKAAASAYALFVKSEAKKAKGDIPNATEFIKQIAEKWKNISPEVKARFEKDAEADKKRFESEMETWRELMVTEGNSKLLTEFEESPRRKPKLLKEFEESSVRKPRRKTVLQESDYVIKEN